jgi:hypothetical protein
MERLHLVALAQRIKVTLAALVITEAVLPKQTTRQVVVVVREQ